MKMKLLPFFIACIIALTLISSTLYPEGSPGGKTGSPIDGAICAQCHVSDVREAAWISTTIPAGGWIPGETYTITLSASPDTANYIGFELSAENENEKAGSFIITDSERTQLTNKDKAVTHSHMGTSLTDGISNWQMEWKAPDADFGAISFYAAFNAADGDATSGGDQIYASTVAYDQGQYLAVAQTGDLSLKVFPNPASNYLFIQSGQKLRSVQLFNLNGKQVKEVNTIENQQARLDVHALENGIYLLKINAEKGEVTQRIQVN